MRELPLKSGIVTTRSGELVPPAVEKLKLREFTASPTRLTEVGTAVLCIAIEPLLMMMAPFCWTPSARSKRCLVAWFSTIRPPRVVIVLANARATAESRASSALFRVVSIAVSENAANTIKPTVSAVAYVNVSRVLSDDDALSNGRATQNDIQYRGAWLSSAASRRTRSSNAAAGRILLWHSN
jgi:hypothetical protein